MAVSENTLRKGTREARAAAAAADAPQEELQKTLNQVAVNIHGSFVSRSSPDHPQYDELRLFLILTLNSKSSFGIFLIVICSFSRNIVVNLFLAEGPKGRLKKASIFAAASDRLKREITNAEYQKVRMLHVTLFLYFSI